MSSYKNKCNPLHTGVKNINRDYYIWIIIYYHRLLWTIIDYYIYIE